MLYRQALLEAFPGVEEGVRSIGDRLRGRQRGSLYQVCFPSSADSAQTPLCCCGRLHADVLGCCHVSAQSS